MSQDSDKHVLLSAYLRGDLSPEERAIVEAQLQQDPSFRALAQEMTEFMSLLKGAERSVSNHMIANLRQRLTKKVSDAAEIVSTSALLSASLSNDLSDREAALLKQILEKSPERAREHQALKGFATVLAKGQRPVSDGLSAQLRARLMAKLPKEALEPKKPEAQPIPQEAIEAAARHATKSLRVYAAPQPSPWRNRVLWAAAAAVALVFGISATLRLWTSEPKNVAGDPQVRPNNGATLQPREIVITPENHNVAPEPEHQNVLPPAPVPEVVNQAPKNVPAPQPQPAPEKQPQQVVVEQQPTKQVQGPVHEEKPFIAPRENKVVEKTPKSDTVPDSDPAHTAPKASDTQVTQELEPNNGSVIVQNTNPKSNNGTQVVGTGAIVTPTDPQVAMGDPVKQPSSETNQAIPAVPNPNDPVAAVDGSAVVGAVLSNVIATTPDGKQSPSLKLRDTLPSDTQIGTGAGMIALLLPDGGRLYVNRESNLTFSLKGKRDVTVALLKGEITYKGSGSLTVNSANVDVHGGKEVNVKIQDNRLNVAVMDGTSKLGAKTIGMNAQASMALTGDNTVAVGPKLTDKPDWNWRSQLIFPGESSSTDPKKGIASDQPDNRGSRAQKPRR